jgi:hypothetical protein
MDYNMKRDARSVATKMAKAAKPNAQRESSRRKKKLTDQARPKPNTIFLTLTN